MEKLLIIEDDSWISQSLKLYLENSWFEVSLYYTWDKALDYIFSYKPDLIIMDINLPVYNWIEITRELRKTSNIPVVMLTARSWEIDRVTWLEIWADDYIAKPFSPRELLARINTIIRRTKSINTEQLNKKSKDELVYKDLILNKSKKIVINNWVKVILTWNEFDILKKLIESNWEIVSRETIMTDIIWYDNYLYDRTIDTHIKNLRKKLDWKDLILTVRWEWYRINN